MSRLIFYKNFYFLIPNKQKAKIFILVLLLSLGMIFEMAGLGILIPALAIIVTPNIESKYPILKPFLNFLGNPNQQQLVILTMTTILIVYFIKSFLYVYINWWQSKFTFNLAKEIKNRLFSGYLYMPYTFHLNRNSAQLFNNIQGEVSQFTTLTQAVITNLIEISMLIGIMLILFITEPTGTLFISLFLLISVFLFQKITKKRLVLWGREKQNLSVSLTKNLMQGFGGVKDIKIFRKAEFFIKKVDVDNISFSKLMIKTNTLNNAPRSYLEFISVTALAGLIILMSIQAKPLDLFLPTIAVFATASFRILPSISKIIVGMQNIKFLIPVVDMLNNEFNLINSKINIKEEKKRINQISDKIEIKKLYYQYENSPKYVLNNIDIIIKRSECIGIIGPSGSGKSTFVDLLLGILTPSKGEILIDNTNIIFDLKSWQLQIGYVPQSIFLIDDSLKNNIAFGIEESLINESQLTRALELSQLDDFVNSLPNGVNTIVGERGARLSGGQRQRIGIARALYNNPQILVLDEATSALDGKTEEGVMDSISKLQNKITIIIVAHRLTTLKSCDRIYEFNNGNIVNVSTYDLINI